MHMHSSVILRWICAGLIAGFSSFFYPLLAPLTLRTSYGILQFFTAATLEGTTIVVGQTTLEFIPACAALSAYILLAVLILLTEGISFRKGVFLFLYGGFLIFAANILRIEFLIYLLLSYGKNYFATLHLFLWKVVSSIYVALVWVFLTWRFQVKTIPVCSDITKALHSLKK